MNATPIWRPEPERPEADEETYSVMPLMFIVDEDGRLWAITSLGAIDCTAPSDKRQIN